MYTYIDIGNTNIKIKKKGSSDVLNYSLTRLIQSTGDEHNFAVNDFVELIEVAKNTLVFSSVVPDALEMLLNEPQIKNAKSIVIDKSSNFSFTFDLEGVGTDRLLAVEGALSLLQPPFMVVDAGSAVTVEYVHQINNQIIYEGGLILPGLNFILKSLNDYTAVLPKVKLQSADFFIGKNTVSAMNNGAIYSVIGAIEKTARVSNAYYKNKSIGLVFTGGDSKFLLEYLDKSIFSNIKQDDTLVLTGMEILTARACN